MEIIGIIFIFLGVFFSSTGVLGIIRLPDAFSRLHASGKVSTLGLLGLLIGAAFVMPAAALKALVLGLFILLSAPAASHAIAISSQERK